MKNKKSILTVIFAIVLQQNIAWSGSLNIINIPHYDPMSNLANTESFLITGGENQDIEVDVRLSKELSGIGVGLLLNGLNVLSSRSAAGAGWQTSYLVRAPNTDDVFVFNQAAGNSTPFAWGYGNTFLNSLNDPQKRLVADDWNPLYADHMHPNGDFGNSVALAPVPPGYWSATVADGLPVMEFSKISVSSGDVVKIVNTYFQAATADQVWDWFALEQAFYLDRQVASWGGLRAYLCDSDDQIYVVPLDGPDLYVPSAIVNESIPNESYKIKNSIKYVVFVWNIFGKDVGIVVDVPDGFGGAHLNVDRTVFGSDPNDYTNGNISWHAWLVDRNGLLTSFTSGDIDNYSLNYYIGTPAQLYELGFRSYQ